MNWVETIISVASAVGGGFLGGLVAAFRVGGWKQNVDDRLERTETRLSSGDDTLDRVPVIGSRLDMLFDELHALRQEVREARHEAVTHEECDRRHGARPSEVRAG